MIERQCFDAFYPATNFISRGVYEPLTGLLAGWLELGDVERLGLLTNPIIFGLGVFFLTSRNAGQLAAWIAGLGSGVVFVTLTRLDPIALQWSWLPALIASWLQLASAPSLVSLLNSLLVAGIWCVAGGAFAVIGVLIAAISSLVRFSRATLPVGVLVACLGLVAANMLTPIYSMPNYPGGAQVAPLSPLALQARPRLGGDLMPNPINWNTYLHHLELEVVPILALLLLVLVSLVFVNADEKSKSKSLLAPLAVLALYIPELSTDPAIRSHTPFAALRRLVPGVAIHDLPWYYLPLMALCPFIGLGEQTKRAASIYLIGALVLVASFGIFTQRFAEPTIITSAKSCDAKAIARPTIKDLRVSPSALILNERGEGLIKERDREYIRLVRGRDFRARLQASQRPRTAKFAWDDNHGTAWKTGRPQAPGDYVELRFNSEVRLDRINLRTGNSSDFPRAFRILEWSTPSEPVELARVSDWRGPILWTTDGYPYYGPQSEVLVDLPRGTKARVLRIELDSSHPIFDWAIQEISVYREITAH